MAEVLGGAMSAWSKGVTGDTPDDPVETKEVKAI